MATPLEAPPARRVVGYTFAGTEFDVRARRLVTHGTLRHLEPRTFELLVYLLSHRDRAVTKHELNRALWGGCAVSDGALTQCVWTARRAIGDEKGRSSVIQTLNGVGYRFVGEVVEKYEPPAGTAPAALVESESLVVEALNHLSRAQGHVAAVGLPVPRMEDDDLLRAAIACRRFADSILGGLSAARHGGATPLG